MEIIVEGEPGIFHEFHEAITNGQSEPEARRYFFIIQGDLKTDPF